MTQHAEPRLLVKPAPVRRPVAPRAELRLVLLSFVQWTLATVRWRTANTYDRLRGQGTLEQKAVRLQAAIQGMGRTGVKIGQQLAMRIDQMPLEFSLALAAMDDHHPPMPDAEVRRRVVDAIGGPLEYVFSDFDSTPFASRTAFSWHRATRLDGRQVVVKVRRQGVRRQLIADIVAVGWITWLLELSTLWRPGFFGSVRSELVELTHHRLDLYQQARQQTVFRQMAKRDGPSFVTAPKVHHDLSNHAVLVTDYVDGMPIYRVVEAVEQGRTAELLAQGIDPEVVGRRLLQTAWWASFEELFSVSGRTAHIVLVRPGNELAYVDFEDCFRLSTPHKRNFQELMLRLDQGDVSGAASALVQVLSPLPFIDVFDFTKRLESSIWQELLALQDREAEWWERTTVGLWRAVTATARRDEVAIRQDVLQFMASTLSVDMVAARLVPRLRLLKEFRRYRKRANERAVRRLRRRSERWDADDLQAAATAQAIRVNEGLARVGLWVESTVENLPVTNLALAGKAAYALSQLVRLGVLWVFVALAGVCGRVLWLSGRSQPFDPIAAVAWVTTHPAHLVVVATLVVVTIRKILFRLDDKGSE